MNRTREHARQIAMAISQDFSRSPSTSFADFGSAFGSTDDPFAELVAPKRNAFVDDESFTENTTLTNDDFFQEDPFSPDALAKHKQKYSNRRTDALSDPGVAAASNVQVVRVSAAAAALPVTKKGSTNRLNSATQSHNFATFGNSDVGGKPNPVASYEVPRTPEKSKKALSPAPMSAAARRRVRTQQTRKNDDSNVSPAQSPYTMKRTDSAGSGPGSTFGKTTDHVANYSSKQQQPRNGAVPPAALPSNRAQSVASSSGSSEPVVFDTNTKVGFSFDAFGLDGAEMHREVTEAMNDLAGSHPGISVLLQNPSDDFAAGQWGNSTTISPNDSGNVSATSSAHEDQGFVDGFRVTKAVGLPVHVRESPTRSERSSLTSESLEHNNNNASVNMFKQQAGFYASKPRKAVRPSHEEQQNLQPRTEEQNRPIVMPGLKGLRSAVLDSPQHLPRIPNLDGNLAIVASPLRRQHGADVEFFGEDSSTDDEIYKRAPAHSSLPAAAAAVDTYPQHLSGRPASEIGTDVGPASDVGVASDVDAPSDVGISSDIGGAHLHAGHLPYIEIKDKQFHARNSPSVRTESTAATSTVDEKKEDDRQAKTVGNMRSKWEMRDSSQTREASQKRFERQHVPSSLAKEHIMRLQDQLGSELLSPEKLLSSDGKKRIGNSDEPQVSRAQQQRAGECLNQRTSLASVKERLKTTSTRPNSQPHGVSAKSEGGAAVRHSSVVSILNGFDKNTPPDDSRSDGGGSPAALFAVKLRKTGLLQEGTSPSAACSSAVVNKFPSQPRSPASAVVFRGQGEASKRPFESQAMRLVRQQTENSSSNVHVIESPSRNSKTNGTSWENIAIDRDEQPATCATSLHNCSSPRSTTRISASIADTGQDEAHGDTPVRNDDHCVPAELSPKQLTYRERRDLELRRQKEDEERRRPREQPRELAQRDVASLIKKRIAANKKNSAFGASSSRDSLEHHEDISSQRNRLKPTPSQCSSDTAENEEMVESSLQSVPNDTKYNSSELFDLLDSEQSDVSEKNELSRPNSNAGSAATRLPNSVAIGDGDVESLPLRSPARAQQNSSTGSSQSARRRLSDLVIDTDAPVSKLAPAKVVTSASVSHLLMLQQLQQHSQPLPSKRVPSRSRPTEETEVLPAHSSHAKPLAVTTVYAASEPASEEQTARTPKATMMMLNAFLAGREMISSGGGVGAPQIAKARSEDDMSDQVADGPLSPSSNAIPSLKDDPTYARYFKMLSIGMPMDVVKHAMTRDGLDAAVMDGDHNKPVGIPLKDDPEYAKYFRMIMIGLPMEAVKHAMQRDGLDSTVMDQDHDLPAATGKQSSNDEPKEQDSHRRARLHWKTLRKVTSNSLWAKIDQECEVDIEIDEEEFQELFQAEKTEAAASGAAATISQKRGSTVCVIDSKRANNGGIILSRLKMSHDDMADAVDRIDEQDLTAAQIENVIEYLPTKEERKALEAYMLEGGQDAAEKFEGLCECEKFMVSMMTVKHAKRKVSALLFKLQFESCIQDIGKEACAIEQACDELSSSVRLRQLLGIVLTFGNRLNTAGNGKRKVGAFTLDSLLKLNQAKAFDKKTTFLHYIILIVQRNNELLLNFKDDLPTVFASDKIFWDQCVTDLEEVENQLENVRKIALYQAHQAQSYRLRRKSKRDDPEESLSDAEDTLTLEEEVEALRSTPIGLFTLSAIKYVSALRDKVERTKAMFAQVLEYFGEEEKQMQPHELFTIFVAFSREFDKAKEQVLAKEKLKQREERKRQASSNTAKTPNGKPPTYSPAPSERKMTDMLLTSSNLQPSMSTVLQQMKERSSSVRTVTRCSLGEGSPLRHQTLRENGAAQRPEVLDRRASAQPVDDQVRARALEHHAEVLDTRFEQYSPEPQLSAQRMLPTASTSDSRPRLTIDGGHATIPDEQEIGDLTRSKQSDVPQHMRETPSSAKSTNMIAMRAKARMRRQRSSRSPASPSNISLPLSDAPTARSDNGEHPTRNQSDTAAMAAPPSAPRSAPDDDGADPLSPRSNIRMKRRIEHRSRARRSIDATVLPNN